MVLGQVATDAKSNEITAIPALLDLLAIKGAMVTIDAMGTQKEIAKKIVEKEADYLLAVKANQGNLHKEVVEFFADAGTQPFGDKPHTVFETLDKEHGRVEHRRVYTSNQVECLKEADKWSGIASMSMVESKCQRGEKVETERRYFISSKRATARNMAKWIRGHWSIENDCHWTLDVSLREDESRVRVGHAQENLAMIRGIVLNMLKNEKTSKRGIRAKQKNAGWNHDYLLRVLLVGVVDPPTKARAASARKC